MDELDIVAALQEVAEEGWRRSPPTPVFLSVLPQLLNDRLHVDYREALNGETLKAFINRTESYKKYRLLTHPVQRAKLAIVPFGKKYEFDELDSEHTPTQLNAADVASFAKVLRSLPPHIIADWTIPASLVLKLFESK